MPCLVPYSQVKQATQDAVAARVAELQALHDSIVELINTIPSSQNVLDELASATGASIVGTSTGETVQSHINSLLNSIESLVSKNETTDSDISTLTSAVSQLQTLKVGTDDFNTAISALQNDLDTKLDATDISGKLDTTAFNSTVASIEAEIALKADKSTVTNLSTTVSGLSTTVGQKADSSTVSALATTVGNKANTSDLTALANTVSNKADSSTVTALSNTVAGKVNTSDYNSEISALNVVDEGLDSRLTQAESNISELTNGVDVTQLREDLDTAETNITSLQNDKAPLASPALTGTPTAPTADSGTNTTQLATTAFVAAAVAALVDSSPEALNTLNELAAALGDDPNFATTMTTALGLKAPLADPALTGTPTAPTAAAGTNSTQLATTAFVAALGALKANIDSPTFTGTPAAPTPATSDNSTTLATTAFVRLLIQAFGLGLNGATGIVAARPGALINTSATQFISALTTDSQSTYQTPVSGERFGGVHTQRDLRPAQFGVSGQAAAASFWYRGFNTASAVATEWKQLADLASPTFTGTPAAPTAAVGTNTTQIATTAYVTTAVVNGVAVKAALGANSDITSLTGLTGVSPLPGVTDASDAAAGKVGEIITASNSAVSLTTGTLANVTSLTLTPGDWDVTGSCNIAISSGASWAGVMLSLTSAAIDDVLQVAGGPFTLGAGNFRMGTPTRRINVSANTVVYLPVQLNFTSGTGTASGRIIARRRR